MAEELFEFEAPPECTTPAEYFRTEVSADVTELVQDFSFARDAYVEFLIRNGVKPGQISGLGAHFLR